MENTNLSTGLLQPKQELLKSKQHFEILDGLRGVAALAIVVFHFMEMAISDFSKNFIAHGFLAVDFFFCLSGFVIGYAYNDRIGKMGVMEFFKSRLIRLQPLVILGTALGLLAFLFDPFGGQAEAYSAGKIFLLFLSSLLLIPFPVMEERAFNNFGLNAPAWSLFWEYVANIIFAFGLYKIGRYVLLSLTIASAVLLGYTAYHANGVTGGWAGANFWEGGARILYSFLAGLLIFRLNLIIKSNLGFAGLSILLIIAFLVPFDSQSWITQLITVLFYFPLLIALGAGARVSQGLKKLCEFSGRISYPLYMTHYLAMWMFYNYYNTYKPDTPQLTLVIIIGTLLLLGFAYLVMVFYDEPIRKYLNDRRKN